MLIYAGIDEAGYGPMLGPLCVGGVAFVLPEDDPSDGAPNLWRRLSRGVCRSRKDRRSRIAVDDSKNLKGARDGKAHPLMHLERGVLSFARALHGDIIESDEALFEQLGVTVPSERWYATPGELPVGSAADTLRIASARLVRSLEQAGVGCAMLRCEAIDAAAFNDQVDRMGTKAAVNMGAALRLVDQIWRRWGTEHPRVMVDRHGGRTHYREDLQMAWPDASLQILAETDTMSRYRMEHGDRQLTITFQTEADAKHLPVALASMTAKYVRELLMLRLNGFFTGHLPELKPTAGYVQDGRRYVDDIGGVVRDLGIDRRRLVRSV